MFFDEDKKRFEMRGMYEYYIDKYKKINDKNVLLAKKGTITGLEKLCVHDENSRNSVAIALIALLTLCVNIKSLIIPIFLNKNLMSYIAIVILMIFVFLCGYVLVIAYKLYQNEKKLIKYSIEKEVINNILEEINNPQQIITGKEYKIIVTEIDNNR